MSLAGVVARRGESVAVHEAAVVQGVVVQQRQETVARTQVQTVERQGTQVTTCSNNGMAMNSGKNVSIVGDENHCMSREMSDVESFVKCSTLCGMYYY